MLFKKTKVIFLSILLTSCSEGLVNTIRMEINKKIHQHHDNADADADDNADDNADADPNIGEIEKEPNPYLIVNLASNTERLKNVKSLRKAAVESNDYFLKVTNAESMSNQFSKNIFGHAARAVTILKESSDSWEIYSLENTSNELDQEKLIGVGAVLKQNLENRGPSNKQEEALFGFYQKPQSSVGSRRTSNGLIDMTFQMISPSSEISIFLVKSKLELNEQDPKETINISEIVNAESTFIFQDSPKLQVIIQRKDWIILEMFTYEKGVVLCLEREEYRLYLKSTNENNESPYSAQTLLKNTWNISGLLRSLVGLS